MSQPETADTVEKLPLPTTIAPEVDSNTPKVPTEEAPKENGDAPEVDPAHAASVPKVPVCNGNPARPDLSGFAMCKGNPNFSEVMSRITDVIEGGERQLEMMKSLKKRLREELGVPEPVKQAAVETQDLGEPKEVVVEETVVTASG
jgi:hypothetical protein